jgi:hypothetical protein
MHGRRSHPRFSIADSDGVFHVLREVSVRRTSTGELVVVDSEPRAVDEVLTLETFSDGKRTAIRVRVVDSAPVIWNGQVLHELRLMRLTEA